MKIYVFCPDSKEIRGGIKQLYRMVDVLNEIGYDAYLIHSKPSAVVNWFKHNTKKVFYPFLYFLLRHWVLKKDTNTRFYRLKKLFFLNKSLPEKDAVIVFPEIYGPDVIKLLPDNPFVLFNQNCYLTFHLFSFDEKRKSPYLAENLLGSLVVSEDSKKYLQFAYPKLNIQRVYLGLDSSFNVDRDKDKIIAFMPRKLSEDVLQVVNLLKVKGISDEWKFVSIDNKTEREVAEVLQRSIIFLSFNDQEGFGLPPVEAMACGCYVIGYTGRAGEEYFKDEFSSSINNRDITAFASEVLQVVKVFDEQPQVIIDKGLLASAFVRSKYNHDRERESIISGWQSLLLKKYR